MKKSIRILSVMLSLAVIVPTECPGQFYGNMNRDSLLRVRDSLNNITVADHANMMARLGIRSVRPGRDPNATDPSRQPNYDELMANPYCFYPDVLKTFDGKTVNNAGMWNRIRRPELVKVFEEEVYGRIPDNVPGVHWRTIKEEKARLGGVSVVIRQLLGVVDNSAYPEITVEIQAQIVWPDDGRTNMPVILEFSWMMTDPRHPFGPGKPWQQMVVERGWAAAQIVPTSVQADGGYGLREGIIGLCNKGQYRKPADWGSLRAWGWGASEMIDYFETEDLFDATKVAVEGVSRYGKAALVAMAFDERIAAGFICSSGKGGAAPWRRDCGESLGNLASDGEYHWMAGNFIKYGAEPLTEDDLPMDQHALIALCAPRPCFISAGSFEADKWVDIAGMFIAASKASPVYELLGKKGLGTDVLPVVDFGLLEGELAYRQHHGGHEAGPNWPFFLDFFARYTAASQ
ncbi:MAG: acetylxylan esterase [Bacteroidales bacterium]|nr:acetylxylan esterase [Bacteroidales bacterium]MDD4481572.1 acetylxylan esterase [Bacteroidales bacterium]MDY0359701.1 acetylxylan esterase [Bacteroidales bacterium]